MPPCPSPSGPLLLDGRRPDSIRAAAEVLRSGGLVALPTETVYGLGADARNAEAVARVFRAKGRPSDNPLIVHLPDAAAVDAVARMTPLGRRLAARWWPGPLTLVLQARPGLPALTTAGLSTVAVRVPDHPVALELLLAADVPVAAPSANRSGRPSPTTAAHVLADLGDADLGDAVAVVLDGGPCRVGVESTVVDARGELPVVLREGAVTREQLGARGGTGDASAASPGTRHRHYAPACEVLLRPRGRAATEAAELAAAGRRVGLLASAGGAASPPVADLGRFGNVQHLASMLYGALRDADARQLDVCVLEEVPEIGLGRAVMDRMRRAAAGSVRMPPASAAGRQVVSRSDQRSDADAPQQWGMPRRPSHEGAGNGGGDADTGRPVRTDDSAPCAGMPRSLP